MAAIKSLWRAYHDKYGELSLREKVIVLVAGLMAISIIFSMLIIEPRFQTIEKVRASNERLQNDMIEKKNTIQELNNKLAQNPNDLLRAQIAAYRKKLDSVDGKLTELTQHLITPEQMRPALTQMLALEKGVLLLSFESLPVQPVSIADDESSESSESSDAENNNNTGENSPDEPVEALSESQPIESVVLYQHGIRLRLTGGYQALKRYLALVEQLPWRFYWQSFDFKVAEYPNAELELHLFSLSTNKEFIGV